MPSVYLLHAYRLLHESKVILNISHDNGFVQLRISATLWMTLFHIRGYQLVYEWNYVLLEDVSNFMNGKNGLVEIFKFMNEYVSILRGQR